MSRYVAHLNKADDRRARREAKRRGRSSGMRRPTLREIREKAEAKR